MGKFRQLSAVFGPLIGVKILFQSLPSAFLLFSSNVV